MEQQDSSEQVISQSSIKYASFGRRFLSYFVDFEIIFLIGTVFQSMFGLNNFSVVMNAQSLEDMERLQAATNTTLPTLISLSLGLLYFLIFWVNYDGATPGKRLMAIKITKDDGQKISYPVAFIRYITTFLSSISLGLGYLWVIWDKRKQTWHDKMAKTVVIETGAKPRTVVAVFFSIIAILMLFAYMGAIGYKSYEIAMLEAEQVKNDGYTATSFKESEEGMNPEAKIHYDLSQELFEQMRQSSDPAEVQKLNDKNILELKMAIEIEADNSRIWLDLGSAYTWVSSEGSLEDGLEAFKKAEEFDPNNVVYINNVGDMLVRLERYEDAVLQFQKTFRLTEESGFANLSVATAYKKLGIYDSARDHFQKSIEIFAEKNTSGAYDDEILLAKKEMAELPK